MSAKELAELRSSLLSRRREIVIRLRSLEAGWNELGGEREIEIEEEAQKADVAQLYEQLDTLERQEVEEIDHALNRMKQGGYGICEECGADIGDERLGALPATRWCRRCAATRT